MKVTYSKHHYLWQEAKGKGIMYFELRSKINIINSTIGF
jgi:hypothetical protein